MERASPRPTGAARLRAASQASTAAASFSPWRSAPPRAPATARRTSRARTARSTVNSVRSLDAELVALRARLVELLLHRRELLLELRVGGLVHERALQRPLGGVEAPRLEVGERGGVELAAVRGLPELLLHLALLLLLHRRLLGLGEAELPRAVRPVDVGEVARALPVVAQHRVRLVDAPVDAADEAAQLGAPRGGEAIRVVRARLAVVGGLDLVGRRALRDLEDPEVVELIERAREGLHLTEELRVHCARS